MTNNKARTVKMTKTMLFAGLIATLLVSSAGINSIEADETIGTLDKIPDDRILERIGGNWVDQYKDADEFEKFKVSTHAYLTASSQTGWGKTTQQENLRIYNFETIVGERGVHNEVVALFAAKEQTLGTYALSEAVARYHEWTSAQYDIPSSLPLIEQRINELVGSTANYNLAEEVYAAANVLADHGSVSPKMIQSDGKFWVKQLSVKSCSYQEECDAEELQRKLEFTDPSQEVIDEIEKRRQADLQKEVAFVDFFLPKAYASWEEVHHYVTMYIEAASCDAAQCYFDAWDQGIGQLAPNASSGGVHTTETLIYAVGTSYSSPYNPDYYHYVSMQMTDPAPTNTLTGFGYGQAYKNGYLTKSSAESNYKATNTSNAWDP